MSDKSEEEIDDIKKLESGDLLSFGVINLLFSLNLEKQELKKYKIKWEKLESLENLKFLRKHKNLWKKIEISSNNDTMNILLHINKSSQKLIKIGFLSYKKIKYKDKQKDFENLIKSVTSQNGLFLTSCDICDCPISIQLLLKYEKNEKKFILLGEPETEKKEVKGEEDNIIQDEHIEPNNEEKKSEKEKDKDDKNKNEENNPFVKIKKEIIEPGKFNYIFFNYNDYVNGEFSSTIKIEHLYEYFQTLKITTKSKIILNFEDEIIENNDNLKDLLSITDLYIFYNKNKLYNFLKQIKEKEDNYNNEKLYYYYYKEAEKKLLEKEELKQQEQEKVKNYIAFLEKNKTEREKNKGKKSKINNNEKKDKNSNNQTQSNIKKDNIYITQSNINKDKEDTEINKANEIIKKEEEKKEEKKKEEEKKEEEKKEEENKELEDKKEDKKEEEKKEDKEVNKYIINTDPNEQNKKEEILKLKLTPYKTRLMPLINSPPHALNKNDLFDYFKYCICDRDPQKKSNDKILIVLDEMEKLFYIIFNKNDTKPNILDFDIKLYPQMNIRNMKEILEFKNLIRSKFSDYIKIFLGTILSTVLSKGQEKIDENTLFLGYLYATNTIKKLAEIQKYNLPMPKEKEFFYPNIKKNGVEQIILKANQRKKEKLFILDGNNKKSTVINQYNPLLDKNLYSYFNSQNNKNFLQINGFIKKDGEINYDPIYRETLGFSKIIKDEKDAYKSFQKSNKFLYGYRKKSPGYSIYNGTKEQIVLPPINQKRQPTAQRKRDTIDEESNESGSGSGGSGGSGNGSASGSGNGD